MSRVTCAQKSGDETTWFSYELLKTVITDPDGNNKTQKSNLLGKIIEIVEHGPTDHSTLYSYNPAGDLLKVSRMNPSTGNPIENILTCNTLGQKLPMADPDMGGGEYTYDLPGRTVSKSVTKNSVLFKSLNYAFYPGTNLLERVSDGSNNTLAVITRYSPRGKMESISFGGGKTVTNYDYV
ncbi:MAG: hypothetical protein WC836_13090, partial [Desulfobacula sp.]